MGTEEIDAGIRHRCSIMLAFVSSLLFWLFVAVSSILLFPVAFVLWLITLPFDRRLVWLHAFTCFWAGLYTWCSPAWSVRVEGRDKIRRGRTYVLVANHQSVVDIFVLFRLFRHFKWVSKIENFRLPCIGWNMSLNRYIKLRRGDRDSVLQMLRACERTLAEGSSIMMFPEGTRSKTGEMRPFKPGAFEIALKTGTPIVPIAVSGTADALPKHGIVVRGKHRIVVRVLDAMVASEWAGMDATQLAHEVRRRIQVALDSRGGQPGASSV